MGYELLLPYLYNNDKATGITYINDKDNLPALGTVVPIRATIIP